jgi:hypothetical protein
MHAHHVTSAAVERRDIMMTYHTQTEISQVWDQIADGSIGDGSKLVTHGRFVQALRIPLAGRYRDDLDRMSAGYLRQRESEEATWGLWQETL